MERAEYSTEELIRLILKIRFQAWYDIQQFQDASYSTESQKEVANWAVERLAFIQLMCESVIESDDLIEYPK